MLCVRIIESVGALTSTEGERSALKTHKNAHKLKKSSNLSKSG
jgi:hypothetical protein